MKYLYEDIDNFHTDVFDEFDKFRLKFLGKKGVLTVLFEEIKNIPLE